MLTLTDGPAITSLAVAPGGAYLIAHMVAHTLQLWPLANISSRLQAIAPAESPARMLLVICNKTLSQHARHCVLPLCGLLRCGGLQRGSMLLSVSVRTRVLLESAVKGNCHASC